MCGVSGVLLYNDFIDTSAARLVKHALVYLQHRGQDSVGVAVSRLLPENANVILGSNNIIDTGGDKIVLPKGKNITHRLSGYGGKTNLFSCIRELGMVRGVLKPSNLEKLVGDKAIGSVRYATTGRARDIQNVQPFIRGNLAVVLNGDIVNAPEIRKALSQDYEFFSKTDVEDVACLVDFNLKRTGSPIIAVRESMKQLVGAYFLLVLTPDSLIVASDPNKIRPGGFVKLDDFVMASSESAGPWNLEGWDFEVFSKHWKELLPGQVLEFKKDGTVLEERVGGSCFRSCFFEGAYFSRPDSILHFNYGGDFRAVEAAGIRYGLGKGLARILPERAAGCDFVVPILDSATMYAVGISHALGVPYMPALFKNKYALRTFIQSRSCGGDLQRERKLSVRAKHSASPTLLRGRRVILPDDSIVRANTMKNIVSFLVGKAGVSEAHVVVGVPEIRHKCFYGIDMDEDLIAAKKSVEEIREYIGATTLTYAPLSLIRKVMGGNICSACLTGEYPTEVDPERTRFVYEDD